MKEEKSKKVIYIRHAQSVFNVWSHTLSRHPTEKDKIKYAEEYKEFGEITFKFDLKLWDPHLSSIGRMQTETCTLYKDKPIFTVFVSPLRRAMETCEGIFKSHPNHDKIHFIVHPLIREILNNTNDMPILLQEIKDIYEPLGYDFGYFKEFPVPQLYFLYNLNSPDREELLKATENIKDYSKIIQEAQIAKRKSAPVHHRKLESYINMRYRAVKFAEFLNKYIDEIGRAHV